MVGDPTVPPEPCLAPTLEALGDRPREALDRLAAAGFRAVQLAATQPGLRPRDLDRSGRRDLLGRLRRLEMTPGGLDLWIPAEHYLDPTRSDRAAAAAMAAIELAADLDRCPLCLQLPAAEDAVPPSPIIEAITEKALRFGVPLADHAVPPADRPEIGVGVDPAAWLSQGEDPTSAVVRFGHRLVTARLTDLSPLDVVDFRVHLAGSGFEGPVVVDMRQWPEPWPGLIQASDTWSAATP